MKLRRFLITILACVPGIALAAEDTAHVSFQTYGFVNGPGDAARALVARRWHIGYQAVAGCIVTQELIDSAKTHNAQAEAMLARRHGKDWRRRYEADIEAEQKRQRIITAKLNRSTEIQVLRSSLKKDYNAPWYRFDFDEQRKLYTVDVQAWDKQARNYRTYYILTAGLNHWELRKI